MAAVAARTFCPNLEVLAYNAETYRETAETIWDVIAEETSYVEPVTPELCYAEFFDHHVMRQVYMLADQIGKPLRTFRPVKKRKRLPQWL